MSVGVIKYEKLITSLHNQRPKFMAVIDASVQPSVDLQNVYQSLQFDVDTSVGQQLDYIGQWVGVSRNITIALPDVFFSCDIAGLGFDEATWFGPTDNAAGLLVLPDDSYRVLLKARIASNNWDGTVPGAYSIWAIVFAIEGFNILIEDNQDMTMNFILLSPFFLSSSVTAVVLALLVNGYLDLRPAGVKIAGYYQGAPPLFGFDVETAVIAGFDEGSFVQKL